MLEVSFERMVKFTRACSYWVGLSQAQSWNVIEVLVVGCEARTLFKRDGGNPNIVLRNPPILLLKVSFNLSVDGRCF